MSNITPLRSQGIQPALHAPKPAANTVSSPSSSAPPNAPSTPTLQKPRQTNIPQRYVHLEPPEPITVINNDPVFNSRDAAILLGVSEDLLKKWRHRDQGPDYIQYEANGPVRYEFSVLFDFRARHRVKPRAKRRSDGRQQPGSAQ